MYLNLIFFALVSGLLSISFISDSNLVWIKKISLYVTGFILFISTLILVNFDNNVPFFQNISLFSLGSFILNLNFWIGLDGISLLFFFLSSLLIFLCILFIWNDILFKKYVLNLLLIELFLLLVFSVLDLLLFYIFFEAILIPMFLLIGLFGSRERKTRAAYLLFFYTLIGSLFMLLGIIYIYSLTGTLSFEYLLLWNFTFEEQYWLWIAFFLSFASKIPLFPFHIWLPEAHVEAPTVGSVLLAGILLKLGVYGFLRFSLTLFPDSCLYFSPFIYLLSILGIVYASLNAIRQTDLKRIIAYSSIAHMNLVVLGIFSFNSVGIEGSMLQSVSHGFVASGMFLLIGILYDRYHSRLMNYYSGLVHLMPLYSTVFLIFTMANIALPGTSSFMGEFLLLVGIFNINIFACIFSCLSVILSGGYSLWLYNRIIFGNLKIAYTYKFNDLNIREFFILFPLLINVFFMGVFPGFFLKFFNFSISNLSILIL